MLSFCYTIEKIFSIKRYLFFHSFYGLLEECFMTGEMLFSKLYKTGEYLVPHFLREILCP